MKLKLLAVVSVVIFAVGMLYRDFTATKARVRENSKHLEAFMSQRSLEELGVDAFVGVPRSDHITDDNRRVLAKAHEELRVFAQNVGLSTCVERKIVQGPTNIAFVSNRDMPFGHNALTHLCKDIVVDGQVVWQRFVTDLRSPVSPSSFLVAVTLYHEYTHQCQFELERPDIDCEHLEKTLASLDTIVRYETEAWENALQYWNYRGGETVLSGAKLYPDDVNHIATILYLDKARNSLALEEGIRNLFQSAFPRLAKNQP